RNWAKEGKNVQGELSNTVGAIKNAKDSTQALAVATDAFGAEGAQRLVTAIRSGNLSLQDLSDTVDGAKGSIESADADTRTFAESWQILKNKGLAAVEPIAPKLFTTIADGMTWIVKIGTAHVLTPA